MRPLIVDAGANIGAASLDFLRTFPQCADRGDRAGPTEFRNTVDECRGLSDRCLHAAVTARPGLVRVVDPGEGHWGFRTEPLADGGMTGRRSGGADRGDLAGQPADMYPFIVKIDIEGAEDDLFSDNIEWLKRTPLVMIELHDWLFPSD